ncbi:hypothetical protein [Saccharopolyspora sp. ASAGF58]|uniref:hypothetical protein n=1 Tax=Saccharopolyspora sp. ASAGF58 TaxID=2719023 RepID=UPI0014401E4D|nr:hypothetical protein [Saccharopolyspora sp. ASAGF58]QIZ33443.1 hypothetical protein FDZ84_00120 [Saccharopolyspora sp. ASAGF58]
MTIRTVSQPDGIGKAGLGWSRPLWWQDSAAVGGDVLRRTGDLGDVGQAKQAECGVAQSGKAWEPGSGVRVLVVFAVDGVAKPSAFCS